MTQELPVQMHPRYPEFFEFMRDCPHRKTPETMQTAFWAWLEAQGIEFLTDELLKAKQVLLIERKLMKGERESLKSDLDRLHRERDNFQQQCSVMAEENSRLEARIKTLENVLDYFDIDEPCTSVDNANIAIEGGY